ncbi:MAG: hypothetical protein AAF211_08180 [Myxococcota bacterium]
MLWIHIMVAQAKVHEVEIVTARPPEGSSMVHGVGRAGGPDGVSEPVSIGPVSTRCRINDRRLSLELRWEGGDGPRPEVVVCRVGRHEVRASITYLPELALLDDGLRLYADTGAARTFDLPEGHRWRTAHWEHRDGMRTGSVACTVRDGRLQLMAHGDATGVGAGVCRVEARDGTTLEVPIVVEVCGAFADVLGTDDPQCPGA